jgi:RNA polymerase sigma-70 factor (ECF subfamily)
MAKENTANSGRELMLKVAKGEEHAFEELVSLFQKPVINTIYRYLGDAGWAEDLAQEVFLKIYQARNRYKPLAKFQTWLHRIVYNVVINASQSQKKRRAYSLESLKEKGWEEGGNHDRGDHDPVEHLMQKELHRKVRETVIGLPAQQRMALVLNKYQGLSYQEIAETMHMTVEAVKSMLYRAREKVKSKLRDYVRSEVPDEMDM